MRPAPNVDLGFAPAHWRNAVADAAMRFREAQKPLLAKTAVGLPPLPDAQQRSSTIIKKGNDVRHDFRRSAHSGSH